MSTAVRRLGVVWTLAIVLGACGGDSDRGDASPTATTTSPPVETTTRPTAAIAEPRTEEIRFSSDGFDLVGDLVLPGGQGPHPAVIAVSGSGSQTRTSTPGYHLLLTEFGDAGYAVFSWDKPGSGASSGEFEEGRGITQRADILLAGIDTLTGRDDIDPDRIGLWGLSQAGWIMPIALDRTDDVAFMISVSGGGEDSIEQLAYRLGQDHVCDGGGTPEEAELIEVYGPQAAKGTTYELYVEAMEVLGGIDGFERLMNVDIADEDEWQPWPSEIDAYLDPMDVIEHTTIPVLAVFGELDRSVDPVQGAAAYERALAVAANPNYQVELIPGVGHTMYEQSSVCAGPSATLSERYVQLLDEWISRMDAL